jgi:hypothetical protein
MTYLFAADLDLWCIVTITVLFTAEAILFSRLWLEVIRGDRTTSGYESGRNYSIWRIFCMHRSIFLNSWKRRFIYISVVVQLLAFIPYVVLEINDLMDNHLLHLTSRVR